MQYIENQSFRITIPKQIADEMDIKHGDMFKINKGENNTIIITPDERKPAKNDSSNDRTIEQKVQP